nr:PREDICTED: glycoprotein integral membrane protein 1 isoform X2 [Anolis carolinensis]XP_008114877.1 PREDICTED: glycoprotein integral membrane protein 1 isoform X2 [Anolis carolinensis]|eukprot:XP_008114876.1 PREDICTED: glycoprotein integral membrane protein 1 isoform X2 [Anolis carolinensis]
METAAALLPGPRESRGFLLLLLLVSLVHAAPDSTQDFARPLCQESIKIKVNMLGGNGNIQEEQVVLNISYINDQVYVNDFPLRSGVSRLKCQTLILRSENSDSLSDEQQLGIVNVRIMVHEWPMASSSNLRLIVVQEEVTEIDGIQVQQDEVTEIDVLVKDVQVLRHTNYTVPLKESMLYSIPRDNDVLFTLPNIAGKVDIESPLQTTSHYLLRQVETTIDEETVPGKLPETPLRAEPTSSYKVMCQWVEDLRKDLCRFWFKFFPVFFNFMGVVLVGVVGASLILKVLKVLCPSCEPREILHYDVTIIPVVAVNLHPEMLEKTDLIEEKYSCNSEMEAGCGESNNLPLAY